MTKSNYLWPAVLAQTNSLGAVSGRLCSSRLGAPGIVWAGPGRLPTPAVPGTPHREARPDVAVRGGRTPHSLF